MSYGEKIQIARLFEKTSKNGNTYFVGRMGPARILMFRNDRSEADGIEWSLFVQAANDKKPTGKSRGTQSRNAQSTGDAAMQGPVHEEPFHDDPVAF